MRNLDGHTAFSTLYGSVSTYNGDRYRTLLPQLLLKILDVGLYMRVLRHRNVRIPRQQKPTATGPTEMCIRYSEVVPKWHMLRTYVHL